MKTNRWGAILSGLIIGAWLAPAATAQVGSQMPDEGRQHISVGTPGSYGHYPPTSGPHWPRVAAWGVQEQELPPEIWVHNLEHGGIVILYRCEIPCPDLIRQLGQIYETFPKSKYGHVKLVVSPNRAINTRLAILGWTWMDAMEGFDRERLLRFYQAHVDKGPEDVP